MGPFDFLWHLAGLLAPAAGVALLITLTARVLLPQERVSSFTAALLLNFVVGAAALLAALWLTGRDGTMLAYAALVLASATSQWLLGRGWK